MEQKEYQGTLMIYDVENLKQKDLNIYKKKTKKTQIILYDTKRRLDDFLNKLRYRKNGMYDDIPHFVISKTGIIYSLFDTNFSSNTFNSYEIDKKLVKIALENLGWLNKNTINGFLYNWINDPYRTEPYIKEWRNHFYWDKYTEQQIESVKYLCEIIKQKHNIKDGVVPSQGYFENVYKFKGIVCKSNYSDIYTDINPSFNFNIFNKNDK